VTVCSSVKDVDGFINKYVKDLKEGAKEMIFSNNVFNLSNFISTTTYSFTMLKFLSLVKQVNST